MKRGRRPREDELALWRQVARTTDRVNMPPLRPDAEKAALPKTETNKAKPEAIQPFRIGQSVPVQTTPTTTPEPAVKMDASSFKNLRRGKMSPEGRIDLHGMTLAQAHPALTRFVLQSHAAGRRLVLVITGKGQDRTDQDTIMPERRGVLRREVPHWLRQPPLAQCVLQVSEANRKHGGAGAFYVYLRRLR